MKILILLILFIFSSGVSSAYSENIKLLNLDIAQAGKGNPRPNPQEAKKPCTGGQGRIFPHGQIHPDGKRICNDGNWIPL